MSITVLNTNAMYNNNIRIVDVLPKNFLQNQKCLILAGGPSLKYVKPNITEGWKSIGVNRSFEKYNTDILYCMDQEFYDRICQLQFGKDVLEKFINFNGKKVFLALPADVKYSHGICVVNRIYPEEISYNIENGIHDGANSALGAIFLAIALGSNDIFIAGLDLKATDATHYHSGYKGQDIKVYRTVLSEFKNKFEQWSTKFESEGIKITQLIAKDENETNLNCFFKQKIENQYII